MKSISNLDSIHFWMVFQITKKCALLPMIVIEFAFIFVELDQIFGWSESANGSQRWRHYADWNKKDLQFGFHSFLHGISNYKKMSLLPMIVIELAVELNLDSIHFWMVFQITKNELVANDCYWIGSGTRPDLWLKWICQWIPKMKMMCWCKWKGSPIQIPFIFE